MGGPGMAGSPKGENIFDLDFNEHRRKNPTKTSLASNTSSFGNHLFRVQGKEVRLDFANAASGVGVGTDQGILSRGAEKCKS